ncbi:MAG: DUF2092 domain-containing protein [Syntrophobacterales bacterium]|jgi:hypothetical protein|nr:DUF2092 domain-containing protein [Syntrophobacterales bacterium]
MSKKISWGLCLLAVLLLVAPVIGFGQEKTPAPAPQSAPAGAPAGKATAPEPAKAPKPAVDPKQVLQKMCEFLKNQPQFSFKAEVTDDQVYAGGRKLQYGQEITASFRRPDKLRLDGTGDQESKLLIFDGKTLTLYDKDKNHYASLEAAGDIDAALDKAYKEYGLKVGLAELGSNRLAEHASQGLTNSLYVGESKVRGVPCHHLAFDKENVHYQLWIEAGDQPLLRKVVVTQKKLPGSPQWTAYLSDWNFSPQLADNLFIFTPPEGAQKIKFMPVKPGKTPAPQKAKPKKKGGKS